MLLLDDFLKDLKRTNQFGDENVTNDETTADLLRWLNRYRLAVANMTAWSWLLTPFTIAVQPNTQDITIAANIRKIVAINDGNGGRLQKISLKQALDWYSPAVSANNTDNLLLGYFVDMGMDPAGGRKIRVYGKPGSAANLTAYGVTTFSALTLADIATPANFFPFPDEIMNMINDLMSSRIAQFKADPTWSTQQKVAMDNLRIAMGEEQSDPVDDATTSLPAYYQKRSILRKGGWVA
jgi:hypothetical protein